VNGVCPSLFVVIRYDPSKFAFAAADLLFCCIQNYTGGTLVTLHMAALLVLGLMCGSESNVALFAHPVLKRLPLETHVLVRSALASLLGRVMPFWMAGSTLLNLSLLLPSANLNKSAWRFAAVAAAIQVLAVVFSLIALVPINNRIAKWTPASLPADWSTQEHRWDVYHFVRTCALVVAFLLLALSIAAR
jgi:hypothetical protein